MAEPVEPPAGVTIPVNFHHLGVGSELLRVHPDRFEPAAFNPGYGHARFSPFLGPDAKPVPTLYAAATQQGAMMETIFHDVSLNPAEKTYHQDKLLGQVMSVLRTSVPLKVVDLSTVSLVKMRLLRAQLIDTESIHYPLTQRWAQALHAQNPDAAGLSWISRQDDDCRAYIFFGDRVPTGTFVVQMASSPLLSGAIPIMPVLELAERLGVDIVK
ncbi:MAG: hypothetical protein K0Q68_3236 [Moraxellaceae bacterium]|jgi:hypothetical protein|nr:hypothetical protein [Moraxellaceae bacterium]